MAAPALSTIVGLKKQRRIKTCRPPRPEGAIKRSGMAEAERGEANQG
jgi:hypothetical protein